MPRVRAHRRMGRRLPEDADPSAISSWRARRGAMRVRAPSISPMRARPRANGATSVRVPSSGRASAPSAPSITTGRFPTLPRLIAAGVSRWWASTVGGI
eukprot:7365385-Prymnesium_polylepis.1